MEGESESRPFGFFLQLKYESSDYITNLPSTKLYRWQMRFVRRTSWVLLSALTFSVTQGMNAQAARKHVSSRKAYSLPRTTTAERAKPVAQYGEYDFSLATLDGRTLRLSEYGGKVVLVNIWAPWCGPCRAETPGFVKLYEEYKKKGFEIIGVAVNTNETDVRSFMQKYDTRWPVGLNDDIALKYKTYGLPDSYLFKPDGSVARHFIGFARDEALRPLIEEALKEIRQ